MAGLATVLPLCALLTLLVSGQAKVFERCELSKYLTHHTSQYPAWGQNATDVTALVCLADHLQPNKLNSTKKNGLGNGIFEIPDSWCGENKRGGGCDVLCSKLRDDDILDDYICVQKVINQQGYTAWGVFEQHCKQGGVDTCLDKEPSSLISRVKRNPKNLHTNPLPSSRVARSNHEATFP